MKTVETRKVKLLKPQQKKRTQISNDPKHKPEAKLMLGVKRRTEEEYKYFATIQLEAIDRLTNLVIRKKLKPKGYALLIWIASYCWDSKNPSGERNPCLLGYAAIAKSFGLTTATVGKLVNHLVRLGLVRVEYIVRVNGTHKEFLFSNHGKAVAATTELRGYIYGTKIHVSENGIRVFQKTKRKVRVLQ